MLVSNEELRQSIQELSETIRHLRTGVGKMEHTVDELRIRMTELKTKIYDVSDTYEVFSLQSRVDRQQLNDRMHILEAAVPLTHETIKADVIEALDARHVVTQDGILGAIYHSIQDATRWAAIRTVGLMMLVAGFVTAINHIASIIHWSVTHIHP